MTPLNIGTEAGYGLWGKLGESHVRWIMLNTGGMHISTLIREALRPSIRWPAVVNRGRTWGCWTRGWFGRGGEGGGGDGCIY